MRQLRKHTKPIIGGIGLIILIALAVLIMLAPTGAIMTNEQPATAVSQPASYIPNPVMTSNVTWSSFNSSWGELEYYNGTGYNNLSASPNAAYANPITVIPADISSPQLTGNDQLGWKNSANWTVQNPPNGGGVSTITNSTSGIQMTSNESNSATQNTEYKLTIPDSALPSQNPAYDFITIIANSSMPTGSTIAINPTNATTPYNQNMPITSNTTGTTTATSIFYSINLATFAQETGIQFNTTVGKGYTPDILITIHQNLPEGSASITTTLKALTITTYPIYLGTNATGQQVNIGIGLAHLTNFKMPMPVTVSNNGYSVAVSQTLQNITESQSAISDGKYIEQATYQGTFSLPTAPDLSYGNTVIQMNLTTPGSQYEVANLNGISYLTTLQTKNNGTFVFATVNPSQQNTLILEVEFTAAQWNASTVAPSFFSIQGIEYYWWVGVIGLLSIVGLGAAASSHFSGDEENLKVPKGKFGR